MRTISPTGAARRYAPTQRHTWLLTLAAGDWSWRGATLAATLGAEDYPARLAAVERWREALPEGATPGGLARATAEVRVLDLPGAAESLRDRLAVTPPVGIAATLRLAWLGADGALAEADAAVLLEGRVAAWSVEPLGVRLSLVDELQALANKRIGRLLRAAMLGGGSPSLGQTLPWIFGRLEDAALMPLGAGVVGQLAAPLDAQGGTVPLVSLDGFPTHGRVQIGAELIDYSELDTARATLGSAQIPAGRDAPSEHPKGTTVRLVPPGGFSWLAADHPCLAVESVRADGMTVDAEGWTAATQPLGDFTAQTVVMPSWPVGADGREAKRISATLQGLAEPDGTLIENPARVLARLLTDPRLGGLDAERLDAAAFDAAASALASRDYRFARRLGGDETLGDLLESAAREAGLWLQPGRPIRPVTAEPTPQPAAVEETLDDARILEPRAPARISAPAGFIPPDAVELAGAPLTQGRGRPAYQFPPESEAGGALPRRFTLRWLDLTRSAAAGDLGELIWAHLGETPFEIEQECLPGAALLAAGATVSLDRPPLDLRGAPAWVAAIEALPPARVRLRLRGPWAGGVCWSTDALNFIRRYAFGAHLAVALGGAVVARLGRDGTLRLRGRLRERAAISAGPFAGLVALSGGRLYLNAPVGGVFRPFLSLDTAGNADLAGAVCERSTLAMDPASAALGGAEGRYWLSTDARTGALEWDAAAQCLHLKGIVIENVRL